MAELVFSLGVSMPKVQRLWLALRRKP